MSRIIVFLICCNLDALGVYRPPSTAVFTVIWRWPKNYAGKQADRRRPLALLYPGILLNGETQSG